MANTKISQLPLYTGNTTGAYLVMNNSGQTTTYKVTKETLIGASGTSGTSGSSGSSGATGASGSSGTSGSSGAAGSSGTSGSNGSSGTSGISGSSGTSGDSIFAVTGSVWNTTRNIGITGSLNISGSATSDVNINGRVQVTTPNGTTSIGGNITPNISTISGSIGTVTSAGTISLFNDLNDFRLTINATTGSKLQMLSVDNTNTNRTIIELPCSSSWNGGTTEFKYPVEITGSLKTTELLNIKPLYIGSGSIYGNDFNTVPGNIGDVRMMLDDAGYYGIYYYGGISPFGWSPLV